MIADVVTRPAFDSAVARSVKVQPWPLSVGSLDAASLLAEQPVSVQLRYLHTHWNRSGKNNTVVFPETVYVFSCVAELLEKSDASAPLKSKDVRMCVQEGPDEESSIAIRPAP